MKYVRFPAVLVQNTRTTVLNTQRSQDGYTFDSFVGSVIVIYVNIKSMFWSFPMAVH